LFKHWDDAPWSRTSRIRLTNLLTRAGVRGKRDRRRVLDVERVDRRIDRDAHAAVDGGDASVRQSRPFRPEQQGDASGGVSSVQQSPTAGIGGECPHGEPIAAQRSRSSGHRRARATGGTAPRPCSPGRSAGSSGRCWSDRGGRPVIRWSRRGRHLADVAGERPRMTQGLRARTARKAPGRRRTEGRLP
jgi:hypothetical protein